MRISFDVQASRPSRMTGSGCVLHSATSPDATTAPEDAERIASTASILNLKSGIESRYVSTQSIQSAGISTVSPGTGTRTRNGTGISTPRAVATSTRRPETRRLSLSI